MDSINSNFDIDTFMFDDSSFFNNVDGNNISTDRRQDVNNSVNSMNISALCCDEEMCGLDKVAAQTWIYPTNYPIRDYQFNIIQAGLYKNTLVSLPTGLGKTFIAAVIMYNYYRWYPMGKIVFTAPTRPLVAQQIDACYNIMAIPPNDTVEMTGSMQIKTRKTAWNEKRVFFATPQVIYNDLKAGICPGNLVRCIVFDEAHRARGKYAYCQIIETLTEMSHKTYRVLALSATPGSKVDDVINVVKNLKISHLELRTDSCIDVAPFSFSRKINTVVVSLGPELSQLRHEYIAIVDDYMRRLKQLNVLTGSPGNLTKGRIVMLYKEYQAKERGARHAMHHHIMKDFVILIALFHCLELLVKHGARVFLNFFDEHPEKSWIQADDRLLSMLERLRASLGVNPLSLDTSTLPDGTIPEIPSDINFGHPKFDHLRKIMLDHFNNASKSNQATKAIVFCEYRESVNLVHCLLLQLRPLIKPQMFVGQGMGSVSAKKNPMQAISQKQQLRIMKAFREGQCNTLVSTSVGEEGLDIGSVDLIICFDISNKSPVRLVQRCGRTGRERCGQIYMLVTEGKEHQTLRECIAQRDNLNKRVMNSPDLEKNLYKMNPRMLPANTTPTCQKMYITVKRIEEKVPKKKKGNRDLAEMLTNMKKKETTHVRAASTSSPVPENDQSSQASIFNGISASPKMTTPKKGTPQKKAIAKSKLKTSPIVKQSGDIRALFNTNVKSARDYKKLISEIGVNQEDSKVPTILIDLMVDLSINKVKHSDDEKKCFTCENLFACQTIKTLINDSKKESPDNKPINIKKFPDINKINKDSFKMFNDTSASNDGGSEDLFVDDTVFDTCFHEIDCAEQCIDKETKKLPQTKASPTKKMNENFDFGNIDTLSILSDSTVCTEISDFETKKSAIVDNNKNEETIKEKEKLQTTLDYFGLNSIEDIFAESSDDGREKSPDGNFSDLHEYKEELSPSLLSVKSFNKSFAKANSPILSVKKQNSGWKLKKCSTPLEYSKAPTPRGKKKPVSLVDKINISQDLHDGSLQTANTTKSMQQSMFSITQLVHMINEKSVVLTQCSPPSGQVDQIDINKEQNTSPILRTQLSKSKNLDGKKIVSKSHIKAISFCNPGEDNLLVLDSSSEDETMIYDLEDEHAPLKKTISKSPIISSTKASHSSPARAKRKIDDTELNINNSSYFSKCPKIDLTKSNNTPETKNKKGPSLKEKLSLAIKSNGKTFGNNSSINFVHLSQKENSEPKNGIGFLFSDDNDADWLNFSSKSSIAAKPKAEIIKPIQKLQIFKRDSKLKATDLVTIKPEKKNRNEISSVAMTAEDSDDDFIERAPKYKVNYTLNSTNHVESPVKQTNGNKFQRKTKKTECSLIEKEAEDSENSGDELTQSNSSIGSIVDFICDEEDVVPEENVDIQAMYLQSVRSPIKGVFKIPEIKGNKMNVLSQIDPNDTHYEMDSFCVDTNVGLTQCHEMSALEIAENLLKKKRREKKAEKRKNGQQLQNIIHNEASTTNSSPIHRKVKNRIRRAIDSSSESD